MVTGLNGVNGVRSKGVPILFVFGGRGGSGVRVSIFLEIYSNWPLLAFRVVLISL